MARQHQLLQSSSSPSSTTLIFCLLPFGTKIFSIWANAVSIRRNTKSTTLTNWRRTFQNLHSSSSNLLWITMIFVGKTASQHWVNRKRDSQWPVRAYKAPIEVTVIVFLDHRFPKAPVFIWASPSIGGILKLRLTHLVVLDWKAKKDAEALDLRIWSLYKKSNFSLRSPQYKYIIQTTNINCSQRPLFWFLQ